MLDPYVGITDFTSPAQVTEMQEVFSRQKRHNSPYKLHVGVMMSRKTLHGIPNSWQDIYPKKETIASIFHSDDTYNCLHYADYDADQGELWRSLQEAVLCGGLGVHALQLDMVWPDPDHIYKALRVSRKSLDVILQLNPWALTAVNNNPKAVVERLKEYDGIANRVLLDGSMGTGRAMDENALRPFLESIREGLPDVALGVAGGLGPLTLHLLGSLPFDFPGLSIDAQSKLRPSGSARDPVDWDIAADYLRRSLKILDQNTARA